MISGSKSGSTGFVGGLRPRRRLRRSASAAAAAAFTSARRPSQLTSIEERLFFGEDLRVGVVVQGDRLGRALADAHAAALAGGRLDLGLLGHRVDGRHLVGADAHAGEAGGALVLVDLGDHAAGLERRLGEDGGGAAGGRVGLADRSRRCSWGSGPRRRGRCPREAKSTGRSLTCASRKKPSPWSGTLSILLSSLAPSVATVGVASTSRSSGSSMSRPQVRVACRHRRLTACRWRRPTSRLGLSRCRSA